MNIVREGPKYLIIQSSNCDLTMEKLKSLFKFQVFISKTEEMNDTYLSMIGLLDDSNTVLMLSTKMSPKMSIVNQDFEYILVLNHSCEDVLIRLVEFKEQMHIQSIRSTPRMIIMRTTGDAQRYIQQVQRDIDGEFIHARDLFENHGKGTMIIFTEKKINGPLDIEDIHPEGLYTDKPYASVSKFLANRRVKYVNAGIGKKDWSELIIKIYDSHEQYDLHYARITMVFEELDCGLILGESWGRDAAMAFHSVDVYQIRLFTYLDVKDIKKIVLGLEYDNDGERLVDYDLFVKRKKQSWTLVKRNDVKGRDNLGLFYRKALIKELSENTMFELLALERQINR